MKNLIPIIAIFCYFIPMIILIFRGMWGLQSHLLFASYWLLNGTVNLVNHFQVFDFETSSILALGLNLVDFPIVAFCVYFIAKSRLVKVLLMISIPVYVITGIYSVIKESLTPEILTKFIPIGIAIMVTTIIIEIFYYFQKVNHTKYETSIIFILGTIFFHYSTYIIVYLFENHFQELASINDIYTIYYISSIIAMLFAVLGYTQKNLQKI